AAPGLECTGRDGIEKEGGPAGGANAKLVGEAGGECRAECQGAGETAAALTGVDVAAQNGAGAFIDGHDAVQNVGHRRVDVIVQDERQVVPGGDVVVDARGEKATAGVGRGSVAICVAVEIIAGLVVLNVA